MATRRERVVLDLEDNFTAGVARAAAATQLLDKSLDHLSGSAVTSSRDLEKQSKAAVKVGDSSRKAGPEIDRMSGRLRLLADAALILGPALIPIGAAAIPALTAALAGLGAAAGGIGVTILAMHGLADGLKALDAYQLEPTAENLSKLRLEMENLGPAGAHFVRFLDDLETPLGNLQKIARAGLFPGLEDGITALLTRLPQVRRIVFDLADGMGDLAREAGEGLAGDKFTAFFDYLESDARPTLEAFSRSAGNVAEGIANLFVAFAPLNRDFTQGLEGATEAFARWSRGLDENQSFQDFLQYIRESGPQVAALLGALADAFVGIITAAAPMGQVVVPAIAALAKAFAAIANSPIGPPLFTAAAGLIAFNRAAAVSGKLSDSLANAFANLGIQAETTKGKLANIGLAGAAAAVALGTVSDAQEILDSRGRSSETLDATVKSLQDLEDTVQGSNLAKYAQDLHIDIPRLTEDLAKNGSRGEYVAEVQKRLAESSHGFGAAANALAGNILPFYTASADKAYDANKDLNAIVGELGNGLGKTPGLFGGVIDMLKRARDAARDLSGALSDLNGWLDKRQAIRDYRAGIEDLGKALKDGFQPKDAETIDTVGRNLSQVASLIKDPRLQADFLAGARASLTALAEKSGPKAERQVQRLIAVLDEYGLTQPPAPKLDADDKPARTKVKNLKGFFEELVGHPYNAKVNAETAAAEARIRAVQRALDNMRDGYVTVHVTQSGGTVKAAGGSLTGGAGSADGGTVPKSGRPYADRYPYMLADGEEVISNRYGQADRHRALLRKINAGRAADGATAGLGIQAFGPSAGNAMFGLESAANSAAAGLRGLKKQLEEQQKAYDKAKSARDEAVSRRDSISSSIQQGLMGGDIWAASGGSVWAAGAHGANSPAGALAALQERKARAQRLVAAINTLKQKGVSGPALLEIIGDGDVERAEAMAALDVGSLSQFAGAVNDTNAALAAAGLAGGNAIEGDNIREWRRAAADELKELREIKQAIKSAEKANDKAQDRNADKVAAGVNGAASNGHRRRR